MRALFVCPSLAAGGAERQWSTLIPALTEHGIEPTVLALNEEGAFADGLRRAGIEVVCAHMRNRFDLRRLRLALRDAGRDFDVIVTRSVNAHVVGGLLARRLGSPHIATEHSQYDLLPLRRYQRALVRAASRHAETVVCVSKSQIPPLIGLGYRKDRIVVIANAIRDQDIMPRRPREVVLRELGFPEDCFLAAMVAGLRPEKQPLDFVRAVIQAHEFEPRVRGVLVGDGVERPVVDAACEASRGVVRAVGSRNDVADFLGACDVACLTSRSEASPVALLEAIALGKPIVATAVGGVPELVVQGETGELVSPSDVDRFSRTLAHLAADHDIAARVRPRERSQARPSFDLMVAEYAQAFRGAVDDQSPHASSRETIRSRGEKVNA